MVDDWHRPPAQLNNTWRTMIFDFMETAATPPVLFTRGDSNGDQSINIRRGDHPQLSLRWRTTDCLEAANRRWQS